jgi:hypothetical protein
MLNPTFFLVRPAWRGIAIPAACGYQALQVPDEHIWYTGVILMIFTYLEDAPAAPCQSTTGVYCCLTAAPV